MSTAIALERIATFDDRTPMRYRGILTGAAAIDHYITPGYSFRIIKLELNTSAPVAVSEDLVVTLDAGDGATYDTILLKQDLSDGSIQDLVWPADWDDQYESDDVVLLTWTNTGTLTYGLRIIIEHV